MYLLKGRSHKKTSALELIQNPNKSDFSDLLFLHRVQFMNEHLLQLDSNDCNKNRVGHKWNYYRAAKYSAFLFLFQSNFDK